MTTLTDQPGNTVAALREAFDASFSVAPDRDVEEHTELLVIRAGEQALALPTNSLRGLGRCPQVTTVPSSSAALLGVGTVRGAIVAIYSLAGLLSGQRAADAPPWIALCEGASAIGLAFDDLVEQARVPVRSIHRSDGRASDIEAPRYARGIVNVNGLTCSVIAIETLVSEIQPPSIDQRL